MNKLAICTDLEDSLNNYDVAVRTLHIVDDVYDTLTQEWKCIEVMIDKYLLSEHLNYVTRNYPETKFIKNYYSEEAWSITEAIGNLLTRIKNFFTRTIQYIKVFVVVRIGATAAIIKRWAAYCDSKREEVEKYLKEEEKKDISVPALTELLMVAQVLYKEYQDQFTKIATMTADIAASGNNANYLVEEPGRYQDWVKALEKVEEQNPRNTQTQGRAAMSLFDGKWGDSVELGRLFKAASQAGVVMQDLNKLKGNSDKIINDLNTADRTPPAQKTDNDSGKMKVQTEDLLKKRKLEFLKKFTKTLEKLIGTFSTYVSFCGNKCEQLIHVFDKNEKKVVKPENK